MLESVQAWMLEPEVLVLPGTERNHCKL